jgi:hypothetical protein
MIMSQSGKSLFYFGIYVLIMGLQFIFMPEMVIKLTQLPPVHLGWARAIGLLILVIGCYDAYCGYNNIKPLIKFSVIVRLGFALGAVLLFAFGLMPVSIILLGGVDALGAIWTYFALKSENAKTIL